jgi:transcription-repair coupling factor (superfamily II helicase)
VKPIKDRLLQIVRHTKTMDAVHQYYQNQTKGIGLYHCEDAVKAMFAMAIAQDKNHQLFVCASEIKAREYVKIIESVNPGKACFLPAEPYHALFLENRSKEVAMERLAVLNRIARGKGLLVLTTPDAFMKRLSPRDIFGKSRVTLKVEDQISHRVLVDRLIFLGYHRVEQVEQPGEYSLRGGIVDVYDVVGSQPFRIEFFDEDVDSIRTFDPEDQKSVEKIQQVTIHPAKELLLDPARLQGMHDGALKHLEEVRKHSKDKEARKGFAELAEKIRENQMGNDQLLLSWGDAETVDLLDWFDSTHRLFMDEASGFAELLQETHLRIQEEYVNLLEKGAVVPGMLDALVEPRKIQEKLQSFPYLIFHRIHKQVDTYPVEVQWDVASRQVVSFYGRVGALADQITDWFGKEYHVYISYEERRELDALKEMLGGYQIAFGLERTEGPSDKGSVQLVKSGLQQGFELYNDKVVWLTYREIFQRETRKRKERRTKGKKIEHFTQLQVGDYIVHDFHGVGMYMGIEQIIIEGIKKDFLEIKYAKTDKLFIPIDQMDAIQVYMSFGEKEPKLNRLDSAEWKRVKSGAKKAAEDMAKELVDLYAKRKSAKGHAYPSDNEWIREFEEKFPYEETEDQEKAIEDVKQDMESPTPMDRLICGDVGYGKTEVAIRAAFKAVMDSKQVAILVPTTVLAQQHFNNFVQRFSDYPMRIEMLSRFRTKNQQEQIIKDVRKKRVDILIGTHRLLSKDVAFDDLGLLIIDEEQRFGVKHKEKIKALKANIDVIALTATPIPRTLHMSLIGARDMSIIDEPPHNRTPVQTYVMEYNDVIIKDAIQREIARGGQVYYVYNRVHGIEAVAQRIRQLVPEARVDIGHGQMGETKLENVMMDFIDHQFDVLVCTTIIESGLDIARANTLVVENADQMGLSQLYQLRGRVGRSDRLSFAYITYKRDKMLPEVAEKRLKAIRDFTDFGSGFKIAMRDLEIRGAGNILGPEQHGHLLSVGYEMYTRLLEDAVKQLQGEETVEKPKSSVELKIDAYLPSRYIESEKHKYETYRKIAGIDSEQDVDEIAEELIDRYGDIPQSVSNLMDIALIKNMAAQVGVEQIKETRDQLRLVFSRNHYLEPLEIQELIRTEQIKFSPGEVQMTMTVKRAGEGRANLPVLKSLLGKIKDLKSNKTSI